MGDKTGINWTDATWNPVRGCSRVSEGCRNCYAERQAARFSGPGEPYAGLIRKITVKEQRIKVSKNGAIQGQERSATSARWNGVVRVIRAHLDQPMRWTKPRRIFVNSMSDLFHESLTNEQIAAVFAIMAATPRHTFQILTKRAMRMREWFAWARQEWLDAEMLVSDMLAPYAGRELGDGSSGDQDDQFERIRQAIEDAHDFPAGAPWPLPNVWLGVSVENQAAADERIPDLLATPAAVRFLSCEPLLGPVDLDKRGLLWRSCLMCGGSMSVAVAGGGKPCPRCLKHQGLENAGIDWVIAGCESGPGARPCEVAWLRSLRDQCAAGGVAFWLKQAPARIGDMTMAEHRVPLDDAYNGDSPRVGPMIPVIAAAAGSKRKAGGIIDLPYLDGVQHAEMPR